ncbi:MAG: hypothetical protein ACK5R0_11895 [Bacteroidota bacterium]
MNVSEVFCDVASALAQMAPEKIVALKASEKMSNEVERLVMPKKQGNIGPDEQSELDRYLALDLFISLTKARAHALLSK